jgi:hypothetical protein
VRSPTIDQVVGSVFAVFSLLVLWESRRIPLGFLAEPGPGWVPILLAIALLACGIAVAAGGRSGKRLAEVQWVEWRHAVAILGTCAFMALAIERLGYRVTIFVALLFLTGLVEKRGWVRGLAFAGGFSLATHYIFNSLLRVPLPQGPWGL